jgi:hypothetical protein
MPVLRDWLNCYFEQGPEGKPVDRSLSAFWNDVQAAKGTGKRPPLRRRLLYGRPALSPRVVGDCGTPYWRNSYRLHRESARFTKVSS